jgi:NIPSNAP protein
MIYEIRTYNLKPGCVGEYERRFADALEVRSQYSALYGFWHTDIGPLNQVVHIWAYESLQQRASIRAAVARDPSGKWPPQNTNDMVISQESDILIPIKGMDHHSGVHELGGVYELRMYTYSAGALPGVAEAFATAYPGRHGVYPVGGIWTSDLGNLNRLYQLFPYKNWDHRDEVRTELREKHLWPAHTEARPVTQLVRHMIPATFSPLR